MWFITRLILTNSNWKPPKSDYLKLYKDTIEKIVHQEDSSRPFVLSSPSNGIIQTDHVGGVNSNPQDTLYGDMHWYNYYSDGWDPQSYPQGMFSDILSWIISF